MYTHKEITAKYEEAGRAENDRNYSKALLILHDLSKKLPGNPIFKEDIDRIKKRMEEQSFSPSATASSPFKMRPFQTYTSLSPQKSPNKKNKNSDFHDDLSSTTTTTTVSAFITTSTTSTSGTVTSVSNNNQTPNKKNIKPSPDNNNNSTVSPNKKIKTTTASITKTTTTTSTISTTTTNVNAVTNTNEFKGINVLGMKKSTLDSVPKKPPVKTAASSSKNSDDAPKPPATKKVKSLEEIERREQEKIKIGRLGEKFFYEYLINYYKKKGYRVEHEAEKEGCVLKHDKKEMLEIIWCNKNKESGYPYDMIVKYYDNFNSAPELIKTKFIEVKSTAKPKACRAFFSKNEFAMMKQQRGNHYTYRLNNVDEKDGTIQGEIAKYKNLFSQLFPNDPNNSQLNSQDSDDDENMLDNIKELKVRF